ncbi:zf-TFIIB domain-containing protein [bacterium]|nr:zf-TFIIB domain-containing protein [bacterium]
MKCPNCKESKLVMSERKGVEIDYCPDCRGVWLDRGELDKILEKSKEADQPPSHRDDKHHPQSQGEYYQKPYKRKKSIFEELFD